MNVTLHCEYLRERRNAHSYLAQMLDFPDYYGRNLDALFDCLTELHDCTILLEGAEELLAAGGYGARILQTLEDAARANPGLRVIGGAEGTAEYLTVPIEKGM